MVKSMQSISIYDKICCVAVAESLQELINMLARSKCRLVELRIDLMEWAKKSVKSIVDELSSRGYRVIVTVRDWREGGRFRGPSAEKIRLLLDALDAGAWLVDVEYRFEAMLEVVESAKGRVILSYHDFRWTPQPELLYSIAGDMIRIGASIAKLVTMAKRLKDNWRIIAVNAKWPGKVVAFAMGSKGVLSRILAPLLGAPFTYAALSSKTAPGQLSVDQLVELWRKLGVVD